MDADGAARVARLRGELGWHPGLPVSGEGQLRPRRVARSWLRKFRRTVS